MFILHIGQGCAPVPVLRNLVTQNRQKICPHLDILGNNNVASSIEPKHIGHLWLSSNELARTTYSTVFHGTSLSQLDSASTSIFACGASSKRYGKWYVILVALHWGINFFFCWLCCCANKLDSVDVRNDVKWEMSKRLRSWADMKSKTHSKHELAQSTWINSIPCF